MEIEKILEESTALEQKGELKKAAHLLEVALRTEPTGKPRASLCLALGDIYLKQRQYAKANETMEELIRYINSESLRLDDELANAYVLLSDTQILQGARASYAREDGEEPFLRKAKGAIDHALQLDISDVTRFQALLSLADYYSARMDYDRALVTLDEASTYASEDRQLRDMLSLRARCETNTGDHLLAINHYEESHRLAERGDTSLQDLDYANDYYYLGRNYSELGRIPEAIKAFKRAIHLIERDDSWSALSIMQMCEFLLGFEYMNLEDYQAAADHFRNSYKLCKRTHEATDDSLMMLGECYIWMSEFARALKYLRKARSEAPYDSNNIERIDSDIENCLTRIKESKDKA